MFGTKDSPAAAVLVIAICAGCDLDPEGVEPPLGDGAVVHDASRPDSPPPRDAAARDSMAITMHDGDAPVVRDSERAHDASSDAEADTSPPFDAGPPCTCTTTGLSGPVTVKCGNTTCGVDGNTYLCNAPGGSNNWTFYAGGCPGGS